LPQVDTYRALERLIGFIGSDTAMSSITDAHVAGFIATRRTSKRWGKTKRKDGSVMGTISNASVNREVAVLKRLFMRSRRTWKISLPNEPDWRGHVQPEEGERVREIHEDEADKLYDGIREDCLRLNETLLRWTAVNFKTGQIRTKGKGNKWVIVQITSSIRALLETQIGNHPEYVFTYIASRTNKVEGRVRGQRYPLTYSGIQSLWRRVMGKSGIDDLRIHDIRHDFATKLLRQSGNLKLVSKALNHSDVTVTAKYAHVLDTDIAGAMEEVSISRKNSRTRKVEAA
jgi:integrase